MLENPSGAGHEAFVASSFNKEGFSMRTQNQEIRAWRFRDKVRTVFDGERKYRAEGNICFHSSHGTIETPIPQLREAILEVDKLFPWKDDVYPQARERGEESIHYLSPGDKGGGWQGETNIWFHIIPCWPNIRKGQVHAYEKYLTKLTEELAKKKLPGVESVRTRIDSYSMAEFSCE